MIALMTKLFLGLDDNPHMIWDQPSPSSDWPEDLIFHLLNRLTEIEGSLLILSHQPMAAISWANRGCGVTIERFVWYRDYRP